MVGARLLLLCPSQLWGGVESWDSILVPSLEQVPKTGTGGCHFSLTAGTVDQAALGLASSPPASPSQVLGRTADMTYEPGSTSLIACVFS